jgi:hypothetical protein
LIVPPFPAVLLNLKHKKGFTMFNGSKFTNIRVRETLEDACKRGYRIRIFFGKDGKVWNEEYYVTGTIGRPTGVSHVALLINNRRAMGGEAILTDCIIGIYKTDGTRLFWDDAYKMPVCNVVAGDLPEYPHNVTINGELYSRHKTEKQARRLADFMSAKRFNK